MAHREPNGVLHTYVGLKAPEDWIAGIDFSNPAAAVACIAEEFDGWAPQLTALVTDSETDPVPRPIYALPVEHRWNRIPGVTLLGDAAHLMPPSGEGANLAMYDGAELAKAIAANVRDIEAALLAYENGLFLRSASEALEADRMQEMLFGDNAPQSLLDFFTGNHLVSSGMHASRPGSHQVALTERDAHPTRSAEAEERAPEPMPDRRAMSSRPVVASLPVKQVGERISPGVR